MMQETILLLLLSLALSEAQWASIFNQFNSGWKQQGSLHQNGHTYGHRRQSSRGLSEPVPLQHQRQQLPQISNFQTSLPSLNYQYFEGSDSGFQQQPQFSNSRQYESFSSQDFPQTTTSFQTGSYPQHNSQPNTDNRYANPYGRQISVGEGEATFLKPSTIEQTSTLDHFKPEFKEMKIVTTTTTTTATTTTTSTTITSPTDDFQRPIEKSAVKGSETLLTSINDQIETSTASLFDLQTGNAQSRSVITVPPNPLPYPLGIDDDLEQNFVDTRSVMNGTSPMMEGSSNATKDESKHSVEIKMNSTFQVLIDQAPESSANSESKTEHGLITSSLDNTESERAFMEVEVTPTTTATSITTTISTLEARPEVSQSPDKIIIDGTMKEEYEMFLKWLKEKKNQNTSEPVSAGCKTSDVTVIDDVIGLKNKQASDDFTRQEKHFLTESFNKQRNNFRRRINQLHIKTYSDLTTTTTPVTVTRAPFVRRVFRTTTQSSVNTSQAFLVFNSANKTVKRNRSLYRREPLAILSSKINSKVESYQPSLRDSVQLSPVLTNLTMEPALKVLKPLVTTLSPILTTATTTSGPNNPGVKPGKRRVVIKRVKKKPQLGPVFLENVNSESNSNVSETGKKIRILNLKSKSTSNEESGTKINSYFPILNSNKSSSTGGSIDDKAINHGDPKQDFPTTSNSVPTTTTTTAQTTTITSTTITSTTYTPTTTAANTTVSITTAATSTPATTTTALPTFSAKTTATTSTASTSTTAGTIITTTTTTSTPRTTTSLINTETLVSTSTTAGTITTTTSTTMTSTPRTTTPLTNTETLVSTMASTMIPANLTNENLIYLLSNTPTKVAENSQGTLSTSIASSTTNRVKPISTASTTQQATTAPGSRALISSLFPDIYPDQAPSTMIASKANVTKFEIFEVQIPSMKISTDSRTNRVTPTTYESGRSNTFKPYPAINKISFESSNQPEQEQSLGFNQKSFSLDPLSLFNNYYVDGWNDTDVKTSLMTPSTTENRSKYDVENVLQLAKSIPNFQNDQELYSNKNNFEDVRKSELVKPIQEFTTGQGNQHPEFSEAYKVQYEKNYHNNDDYFDLNLNTYPNGNNQDAIRSSYISNYESPTNTDLGKRSPYTNNSQYSNNNKYYNEENNKHYSGSIDNGKDYIIKDYSGKDFDSKDYSGKDFNDKDVIEKEMGPKISVIVEEYEIPDFLRFAVPMKQVAMKRKTDFVYSSYAKAKFV